MALLVLLLCTHLMKLHFTQVEPNILLWKSMLEIMKWLVICQCPQSYYLLLPYIGGRGLSVWVTSLEWGSWMNGSHLKVARCHLRTLAKVSGNSVVIYCNISPLRTIESLAGSEQKTPGSAAIRSAISATVLWLQFKPKSSQNGD